MAADQVRWDEFDNFRDCVDAAFAACPNVSAQYYKFILTSVMDDFTVQTNLKWARHKPAGCWLFMTIPDASQSNRPIRINK